MPPAGECVQFGAFELDLKSAELRHNGTKIQLQEQPFQVLLALLQHPGEVVSRDELRHRLWPTDVYVDYERSLNAAVKRLRHALGDEVDAPQYIETLPRHGYRLVAPVHAMPSRPENNRGSRRTKWIALSAVLLAMILVGALTGRTVWYRFFPPKIRSIAVLPLQNLSNDRQQEYFAQGMTEALISELSRLGPLRVASLTSVRHWNDSGKPLPQIAKELDVDGIVEGSVIRDGDRVRIRTRLIQARIDRPIWSDTYDRDLRDILSLQAEVAHDVAAQIQVSLSAQEKARVAGMRRVDPEAHDAYLLGRYLMRRTDPREVAKAFEHAIAKDPQYAAAYAGLAEVLALSSPPLENVQRARQLALKALWLDESLPEAHTALGTIYFIVDYDWVQAEKELKRAIQLDPGSAETRDQYAYLLAATGHLNEALAEAKLALKLDPFSLRVNFNYGRMLYYNRRYDEAVAHFTQALTLDPRNPATYMMRGYIYEKMQKYNEAFADFRQAWVFAGNKRGIQILDKNDKPVETMRAIAVMFERGMASDNVQATSVTMQYAQTGELDKAFQFLEIAYRIRNRNVAFLKIDPAYDNLRSDPRFKEYLKRINLSE